MQVVELSVRSIDDLVWFADREAGRLHLSSAATGAVIDALTQSVGLLRRELSLRDVKRLLQRAETLENRAIFIDDLQKLRRRPKPIICLDYL
jgi:hypothetical protein